MRILGIDPGVATVGFGVIDSEGGRQRMVSTEPLPPRCGYAAGSPAGADRRTIWGS
ncbi:MAG: hypothetical protein ACLTGT_00995 [Oscillospiraceae bacterium]